MTKKHNRITKYDSDKNLVALRYLLDIGEEEWGMTVGTSNHTLEEIKRTKPEKAPEYYREKLPDLYGYYEVLLRISSKRFEKDKEAHKLSAFKEQALRQKISAIVHDPDDVEHLIEFKNASWDVFLTLDWNDMANPKASSKLHALGINIQLPFSLLESIIDFGLLIRTLHGSWAKIPTSIEDL